LQKIPERLEDWTYGKIEDLINNNVNESEIHDFKSNIPDSIELTKDCCAFANTKGGFIILGVKEASQRFRIAGIDNDKDLANKFGKKINALPSNPNFELAPFVNIPQSNKVLAVIHIARSRYRPHIPSQKENILEKNKHM
jgi:predicted HTH transcriptional regulator